MENTTIKKIEMKKNKDWRIVIIGAGAAGLTVASSLRDRGYQHITLLERAKQAGGKCCTVDIEDHNYELGAGMIARRNFSVWKLVEKYKIPLTRITFGASLVVDKHFEPEGKRGFFKTVKLAYQIVWLYRRIQKKYGLAKPGFVAIDHEELSEPFATFAKRHKIVDLAHELELSQTGFGYGYFSDVSTAYVLKYYSWDTIISSILHKMYFFPQGIQHLWTTVAQDFDVKYGTMIQHISRTNKCITMVAGGHEDIMSYDRLIVTSPLDELEQYMDVGDEEKQLFKKIEYIDYRVIACTLKDFPHVTGYAPDNFSPSRAGYPVFWYHRHEDTDVFIFYMLCDHAMSDDDMQDKVRSFVEKMGGTMQQVHTIRHWKYFPHVSSNVFKLGYYDDLEALQGHDDIYYAGEIMNFSTVGLTSEYADDLVQRFF